MTVPALTWLPLLGVVKSGRTLTRSRRRDVIVQFLTEATVLSAVGGAIGVLLGLEFAYLLPSISSQQTQVSYWAVLLAFVAAALVGIVAGVGPANQAAALEPASALRYE